jgi:hypothetical protein
MLLRRAEVGLPEADSGAVFEVETVLPRLAHRAVTWMHELKPGQKVRVKSLPSSVDGEIAKIVREPDGDDGVVIQISIRRRASDLELIPTSPPQKRCHRPKPVALLRSRRGKRIHQTRMESRHCEPRCGNSGG